MSELQVGSKLHVLCKIVGSYNFIIKS